jgi:hypothetical protein
MPSVAFAASNVSFYSLGSKAVHQQAANSQRQVGCLSLKAVSATIQHIGRTSRHRMMAAKFSSLHIKIEGAG